ncbi:MAG: peptidylprolyl isomerase [bacterium]|nr:peptidylprolyl isomerase [bacterium]
MKSLKFFKHLIIAFLISINFAAFSQNSNGVVVDKIIAKVDDYIILKSDLENAYQEMIARGAFSSEEDKCKILESLIINKLMVAKAEIDSVEVSDDEVNSNLDRRMTYFISQVGSEERLEEFYGKSLDQFRAELFDDIKEQLVVQKMQSEITSDIKVTPNEVKKFYKSIPRDSLPYFSTEVAVGQLVKIPKPGEVEQQKVINQLNDLRSQIMDGIDFGVLAKQYSQDPGSRQQGGMLPFFKRGELAPEYEATALSLAPGEISEPVVTDFGVHIIELIEKRGNSFKSRHILMIPRVSFKDRQETQDYLDSLRTLIVNDSIDFEAAAKEYSDDKQTSGSGGFLQASDGATRISVKDLDPGLFFAIDTMKVGSVSTTMEFDQPDGTKAYRIVYYKEQTPPHRANLKDDYQKIATAAQNSKKNRILSEWFEKAQKGIFIEVDPDYDFCNLPIIQ